MIKNNKLKTLISSIITLLPIVFGLIMWDKLPANMNIHWNISGEADGTGSKALVVFLVPLVLLLFHLICLIVTSFDRKQKEQNPKALSIVFWIIPALSVYVNLIMYSFAFGYEIKMEAITLILLGVLLAVIGNYMPKVKQNSTLGIKIKWTLENEENWNATHRFAGRVWFFCGIGLLISVFFATTAYIIAFILVALLLVTAVVPIIYSFVYYLKQKKAGTAVLTPLSNTQKKARIFAWIAIIIVLLVLTFIMFTGDIKIDYSEDYFKINATYYDDVTVKYEDIDSIEYLETDKKGIKINGFNSARLLLGIYENDEFGKHTRFSYTACDSAVVLKIEDNILVLSGKDTAETKEIYNKLK